MDKKSEIRWGIWGTGMIAHHFAEGLKFAPGAKIEAVASRNLKRAEYFAQEVKTLKAFDSLDTLCTDPEVDIIYIATPNHRHTPDVKTAVSYGKAVLCEKPFALSYAEAESMVTLAREKGIFLMEALWTHFLPSLRAFLNEINNDSIGEPLFLQADFGFRAKYLPESRLFDLAQGGGSLYDIGIYPLYLAQTLFGNPESVQVLSHRAPSGVDMTTLVQMNFPKGKMASLASSFAMDLNTEAHLFGSKGKLVLHRMFHMPTRVTLHNHEGPHEIPLPEPEGNGYQYEAIAAMNALREGLTECPEWNLSQTLALAALIDRIRLQ